MNRKVESGEYGFCLEQRAPWWWEGRRDREGEWANEGEGKATRRVEGGEGRVS